MKKIFFFRFAFLFSTTLKSVCTAWHQKCIIVYTSSQQEVARGYFYWRIPTRLHEESRLAQKDSRHVLMEASRKKPSIGMTTEMGGGGREGCRLRAHSSWSLSLLTSSPPQFCLLRVLFPRGSGCNFCAVFPKLASQSFECASDLEAVGMSWVF